MFMCFRYMNEIRINTKILGLIDTRNHVCLPCDLLEAYFARAPAARTSVHVKSATPMHRGCITDLLCKSVTFTKKRGGLSARQMLRKSRLATLSIAYSMR